jgi:hypothetical protein
VERFQIILGCHPGEKVAKQAGLLVAEELSHRNYDVSVIELPSTVRLGSRQVPWMHAFRHPKGLRHRFRQENRLATADPLSDTVTFHDGPLKGVQAFVQSHRVGRGRLLEVELQAGLRWHPYRSARRARQKGLSSRQAAYLFEESDPTHPISRRTLTPEFIHQVTNLLVAAHTDPHFEIDSLPNTYRGPI